MTGMKAYYISRAILSIVFGAVFLLAGSAWWVALLVSTIAFGWFFIAPRIGRYAVHPEYGVTALRRDERSQGINDKAARNAFVVSMLAVAAVAIYYEALAAGSVPVGVIKWLMLDMGFIHDVRKIIAKLPTERQTMLFSATIPPELNKVASEALHDPRRVALAPRACGAAGPPGTLH